MEEKEEKKLDFKDVLSYTKDDFPEFKKRVKSGSYNYDTQEEESIFNIKYWSRKNNILKKI